MTISIGNVEGMAMRCKIVDRLLVSHAWLQVFSGVAKLDVPDEHKETRYVWTSPHQ